MTIENDLNDALDALEAMVGVYLVGTHILDPVEHRWSDSAASDLACDVLVALRPDDWHRTPTGMTNKHLGWIGGTLRFADDSTRGGPNP